MARFSGRQGEGAMHELRAIKRLDAQERQAEFNNSYDEKGDGMSRKTFGQVRHVERLSNPARIVSTDAGH